jgi:hypothetical protein
MSKVSDSTVQRLEYDGSSLRPNGGNGEGQIVRLGHVWEIIEVVVKRRPEPARRPLVPQGPPSLIPQHPLGDSLCPQHELESFHSPALRHQYAIASSSWRQFLVDRLNHWVLCELSKLKLQDRPSLGAVDFSAQRFNMSLIRVLELLDYWDYADDQIPRWYQEWEQMLVQKPEVKKRQGRH